MTQQSPRLHKKPEEVEAKFNRLIEAASTLHDVSGTHSTALLVRLREIRASSLNLLRRISSTDGEYYRELSAAEFTDHLALHGILQAALQDYREGFMADAGLLVSAEVFRDLLDQAELLLEGDYKDAAAVTIRAVLEDGLRSFACQGALNVNRVTRSAA